jgi:hypothetical protein
MASRNIKRFRAASGPRGGRGPGCILRGVSGLLSGRRRVAVAVAVALLAGGCALGSGTLGGREKCWPESERRAPSVWRGVLEINGSEGRLQTPEGDVIPLLPGALEMAVAEDGVGVLVHDRDVVAKTGDDVTLFGGAGADGALVVCGVEEKHSG